MISKYNHRLARNPFTGPAKLSVLIAVGVGSLLSSQAPCVAGTPFAATIVDYTPAPGQFVNNATFNDPLAAIGPPEGNGIIDGNDLDVVSLGGFGGTIVLKFDHTVLDDPANPYGLDAIVFGNSFWVGGNPNRRWAECAYIEISLDANHNGQPDDTWFLIPGSHLDDPIEQEETQTWDRNVADMTYPPANAAWIPVPMPDTWSTTALRLPPAMFDSSIVTNPNGTSATIEGIFGYADLSPTVMLGDLDADDIIDEPSTTYELFYTVPDDPWDVGVTPGSGGGDAFDIAWAIDPETGGPANLPGFDFIRVTNAVNAINGPLGEKSTEIDAISDVRPDPFGDVTGDGLTDLTDFMDWPACQTSPNELNILAPIDCLLFDHNLDSDVDMVDFIAFQQSITGS